MSQLEVGFSRIDITPPLGIRLMSNNNIRLAENILDHLEVSVLVLPCCLTNGHWGYVGMTQNYIEASYETRGSRLKAGCGELMIESGLRLLEEIR